MEQLRRVQFPIGQYTKAEVRDMAIALELHAVANKPESQDLCFIPDGNTADFWKNTYPLVNPGLSSTAAAKPSVNTMALATTPSVNAAGWGLPSPKPKYVLELNVANNQLIVGDDNELDKISMEVEELNWIQPQSTLDLKAGVKYRSTTPEAMATLAPIGPDLLSIRFDEVQRALAPGQAAVFYQGDEVIGGGTISKITG
jgi:tRNA-specific 2-thiouridylase